MKKSRTTKSKEEIAAAKIAKEREAQERRKALERDLVYIKNDVIAKQANGKYCKYSRLTKSITVINTTLYKYLSYWIGLAENKKASEEYMENLLKIILEKFNNELVNLDTMIELELNSDDSDKEKIIKEITAA